MGGPSRSVPNLAAALARLGHEVELCTTGDTSFASPAPGLNVTGGRRGWPHAIGRSSDLARQLRHGDWDVIHHHALWHRTLHYSAREARRQQVPLVLAPRGMMMPWAWDHHRSRKRWATRLLHPGAFAAVTGWHATSESEAEAIRALGFNQPVCVAPNGVNLPAAEDLSSAATHWRETNPALAGNRRVALFYSRFHAKKRVIELIDLWAQVAPPDWLLLVVGIPDQYSAKEIAGYALRGALTDRVQVHDGRSHPAPYAVAELTLLPTHSENFGLVVAESLAAGVPVGVTATTPWAGINTHGCGWCGDWENYGEHLAALLDQPPELLRAMGTRGRNWVAKDYSWNASAQRLLAFYEQLRAVHD